MPMWRWWAAALLSFMFWTSYADQMGRGYWFAGWWRKVTERPLGDWRLIDIAPLIAAYVAVHLIFQTMASRELETAEKSRPGSEPEAK